MCTVAARAPVVSRVSAQYAAAESPGRCVLTQAQMDELVALACAATAAAAALTASAVAAAVAAAALTAAALAAAARATAARLAAVLYVCGLLCKQRPQPCPDALQPI